MDTMIINLFAGPGAGKSTTAAGLFYHMKRQGVRCELVVEYAKELVYDDAMAKLGEQVCVFGKQIHRLNRLVGQVDYVITDSPILLSAIYAPDDYPAAWTEFVVERFKRFHNLNFFLDRTKPYAEYGRVQNEAEAREIDASVLMHLQALDLDYEVVTEDENLVHNLFQKASLKK